MARGVAVLVDPARPRARTRRFATGAVEEVVLPESFRRLRRRRVADLGDADEPEWDFVLKLGRGPVPAGLAARTRLGVWFFDHEQRSASLPFFREVYDGEDVTRASLLALAPSGEPRILNRGVFRTDRRSYVTSRDLVLQAVARWPARACRRAREGLELHLPPAVPAEPESPAIDVTRSQLLRYRARVGARRLGIARKRLFRHQQWNVGILDVSASQLASGVPYDDLRVCWLGGVDRRTFLADPFAIAHGETLHVLCERFRYRESRGEICAFEVVDAGIATSPQTVIGGPLHLSYPFVVEDAGEVYCVPETSTSNEIALFRADEFPRRWSKAAVLVPSFPGVDPTVFRHEGRWWLLCTSGGALEDVELYAWHAPSLLGPWEPHAGNPIKADVRGSRPAGVPFTHEGALYRPAQDCSRTYGWRIALQRVVRLTPTAFEEEPVRFVEASPSSAFPRGRHTLTPIGDRVLVDGRRDVFVWDAFRAFLRIWAADVGGKARSGRRAS